MERDRNYWMKEYRKISGKIRSRMASLKRLRTKTGLRSTALEQLEESGGMIKARGMSDAQLKNEVMRGKTFLRDVTSTVAGTQHFYNGIATDDDKWDIFKRLRAKDPSVEVIAGKFSDMVDQIDDYISESVMSPSDIIDMMMIMSEQYDEYTQQIEESIIPFDDRVPYQSDIDDDITIWE